MRWIRNILIFRLYSFTHIITYTHSTMTSNLFYPITYNNLNRFRTNSWIPSALNANFQILPWVVIISKDCLTLTYYLSGMADKMCLNCFKLEIEFIKCMSWMSSVGLRSMIINDFLWSRVKINLSLRFCIILFGLRNATQHVATNTGFRKQFPTNQL